MGERFRKVIHTASASERSLRSLDVLRTDVVGSIEGVDDTSSLSQTDIRLNVPIVSAEKGFDLSMEGGPYYCTHTSDGRHLLIRNESGYVASMDTKRLSCHFEINLGESVRDAVFLHNELLLAVAQESGVFVYDNQGVEIHCVRQIRDPVKLGFLPYHLLLVSLSAKNVLRYLDVSVGKMVATIPTGEHVTSVATNKSNGLLFLGTSRGTVSVYSPNHGKYVAKVLCHGSNTTNVCIDRDGRYFITGSLDTSIKVWDLRNNYAPVESIRARCEAMDLSDNDKLAISVERNATVYEGVGSGMKVYLRGRINSKISCLCFRRYEDVLTVGHWGGISNLIIPGSGDPTFDSTEDNPFATKRQRRELEIKRLLEKVPYYFIGTKGRWTVECDEPSEKEKPACAGRGALSRFLRG